MIEILILLSTICPKGLGTSCYEKIELVRNADNFLIVSSTKGAHCDFYGHGWQWQYENQGFYPHKVPTGMKCSICGIDRKIKKVETKRECSDVTEFWEDDGTKVIRPVDQEWEKWKIRE